MTEEIEVIGGHVGRGNIRKGQWCMRRGTNLRRLRHWRGQSNGTIGDEVAKPSRRSS